MFGPHTPTDRAAVLDEVVKAYEAGVFSLETAVRMLMDAGYPIEDATEEIERIQSRQFAAAGPFADATGDNTAVREYLGLPKAEPDGPRVPLISVDGKVGAVSRGAGQSGGGSGPTCRRVGEVSGRRISANSRSDARNDLRVPACRSGSRVHRDLADGSLGRISIGSYLP